MKFTTVIAADSEHLEELAIVWPTWAKHRPEILANPMLLMLDMDANQDESGGYYSDPHQAVAFLDHPNLSIHLVVKTDPSVSQREFMLTQFVDYAPFQIDTNYFLKLDTDVVAVEGGEWFKRSWFDDYPAFVASPWGYSKPADSMMIMDEWANRHPEFRDSLPLNLTFDGTSDRVFHPRVISYVYWGRADWHRTIATFFDERMPIASQDGYCWYCAERLHEHYVRVRQSHFGWRHINGIDRLREAARKVLE